MWLAVVRVLLLAVKRLRRDGEGRLLLHCWRGMGWTSFGLLEVVLVLVLVLFLLEL
jgi:hypothetical protein